MLHQNPVHKIAIALVLVSAFLGCASIVHAQAADLHDAAAKLTKKLHDDPDIQKISGEHIVVAPFENINGKGDAVPRILQEMFTTDFIKAKHFKVLERDQLQSALNELHFQLSDLADPAKAKKIGKLAGAAYVLLGSIADTGNSTSINARIVSIESGESVAAEDEDIKTGDTPLAADGLNLTPGFTSAPDTAVPAAAPAALPGIPAPVDRNARANPTSAGQFTGKKDDFGLLGSTNFQTAWREDLGKDPILSFAAGDILGNGSSRLVLGKGSDYLVLSVQKWDDGNFDQTWVGDVTGPGYNNCFVRLLPQTKASARIFLSDQSGNANSWLWDGTNYARQFLSASVYDNDSALPETIVGSVDNGGAIGLMKIATQDNSKDNFSLAMYKGARIPAYAGDVVAADFDGDGNTELAVSRLSKILVGEPIEIYSLSGVRKATTTKGYGARLAAWNPSSSKHPFLVAPRNTIDSDGKNNGGFVYFIQWNGESYDEVWKSNQIGDAIIDMQVCDPKGEGKTGLVILSSEKGRYYLTKIVLAK